MYIDILIFAMIAAFLVFKLFSVLGRRTGQERQRPNPFPTTPEPRTSEPLAKEATEPDNVIALPRGEAEPAAAARPPSLANALTQIKIADPSFDTRVFLRGAQAAFGMIVEAFAKGDTAALRPLLSDDLYDEFSNAIRERLARGETLETRIESMKSAEIVRGRLDGRTAFVTVRFVTAQVNVTRNAEGAVVEGSETPAEVTDLWTFARNTRSADPNWQLVETSASG